MKIIQKPIELEAWRVSDLCDMRVQDMPASIQRAVNEVHLQMGQSSITVIANHNGVMRAESTDWLIRGVGGEFFPCTDAAFSVYYQEIT